VFSPPEDRIDSLIRDGWRLFGPSHAFGIRLAGAPFSPGSLVENVARLAQRLPLLVPAGLVTAGVGLAAFIRCWRARGLALALVMFGAPLANFAIHVVTFVYATDPVRFTLPALALGLPALMWTAATAFEAVTRGARRMRPAASR
jgi:hypothetical protein